MGLRLSRARLIRLFVLSGVHTHGVLPAKQTIRSDTCTHVSASRWL